MPEASDADLTGSIVPVSMVTEAEPVSRVCQLACCCSKSLLAILSRAWCRAVMGPSEMCLSLQDYDDDGESAAGGRLLKLLTLVGAEDVVVVVSRWYGGVLLGPARFTHINNAARQLLDEFGYVSTKQTKTSKKK